MANRIRPGERLPGIHAASWNEFADTADFVEGLQNPVGGALNAKPIKGTITIPAKLHAALPSFSVVKLSRADQELTNVELGAAPVFDTGAPAEDGAFGITQRHGAATEQVEVVISGYVQAQVDIQSADDETCGVIDNDTDKLESGKGSTPIIWKPSGTGVKWCIVQLGASTPPTEFIGTVAATSPSLTATVTKLRQGADPRSNPSNPLEEVPIVSRLGQTLEVDDEVWVELDDDGTYSAFKSDSGSTPGTDGLKPDLDVRLTADLTTTQTTAIILNAHGTTKASLLPAPIGSTINVFAGLNPVPGKAGQRWVAKWNVSGSNYQLSHEITQLQVVKGNIADSVVSSTTASFTADVLIAFGRYPGDSSGNDLLTVTVDNSTAKISGKLGDVVYLLHDQNAGSDESDQWVPISDGSESGFHVIKGLATSSVADSNASFDIDELVAVRGNLPTGSSVTVTNDPPCVFDNGSEVYAAWNKSLSGWDTGDGHNWLAMFKGHGGWDASKDQSPGHDAGGEPEWQEDKPCDTAT